jgi:anthranilate/para-aminobenzoate synthase component I
MLNAVSQIQTDHTPESLVEQLRREPDVILLRSALHDPLQGRYSFVAARPFLTFTSAGSRCEVRTGDAVRIHFGNPWQILETLLARYEILDEVDVPFPLGGCFGYWGYELKDALESCLTRRAVNDLDLPDCHLGFHDSLVVFDHALGLTHLISTGLRADGSRSDQQANARRDWWRGILARAPHPPPHTSRSSLDAPHLSRLSSTLSRAEYLAAVERARAYIRSGDIYQVNLARRLSVPIHTASPPPPEPEGKVGPRCARPGAGAPAPYQVQGFNARNGASENSPPEPEMGAPTCLPAHRQAFLSARGSALGPGRQECLRSMEASYAPWEFFQRLQAVSPAPFAAYLDCGTFQIASSSPESFLRLSGRHIRTRPIKGTRPRGADPESDTRLAYELQTSPKEQAELVMITDLLRNDLGRVCEFGSVRVPDLFRLERFAHVQHLVSTVEGRLRPEVTHLHALAACFPGGSITGAPKIRAMQIIDELEPVTRGPYTGAIGYLGFNRESQLSIAIRTAVCTATTLHFHTGAGIVADSDPAMEYDETTAKAEGFLAALRATRLAPPPQAANLAVP